MKIREMIIHPTSTLEFSKAPLTTQLESPKVNRLQELYEYHHGRHIFVGFSVGQCVLATFPVFGGEE